MKIFQMFDDFTKIVSLCYTVSYYFLKYKLKCTSLNDAIISTCNSLTHKNYIFTKVIQWGLQEIYKDLNIQENDELKTYFNTFSNCVPYTNSELSHSLSKLIQATHIATTHNCELKIENMHKPINSGSVALIFKGQLNNTPVIIKVLRSDIRNKIKKDVSTLLSFFDNIVVKNAVHYYIKTNFKSLIESNYDHLLDQCNFNNEVKNCLLFSNNLKNKKNIIIPHVYTHFTENCNDIIVMDYIDGDIAKNVPLDSLKCHFETLQTLFFESLFKYNVFHGDFHLGNIIITKNNAVAVIDFGIVYILTDYISDALFDILLISLELNNKSNNTNCIKLLIRKIIKFIYSDQKMNVTYYNKLINDHEFVRQVSVVCSDFSGESLVKVINMLTLSNDTGLEKHAYMLILSFMSGIQTVEYVNENKSLKDLVTSYIRRNVRMD
jgi:tRNA A-37 threonylcarbamoyl transferase component Bud32